MDPMAAIKQTFFQECEEQLSELESGLLRMEDGDHDPETINAVFRAVHSIKGGAGAFGFDDLVEFVHVFETTLDLLRSKTLEPTPAIIKTLLRASDVLQDLVRAAREGGAVENDDVIAIKEELAALCQASGGDDIDGGITFEDLGFKPVLIDLDALFAPEEDAAPPATVLVIKFKPNPSLYAKANETIRLFRQLREFGELTVECDTSEIPFLSEIDPEGAYLSWTIHLKTETPEDKIREVFEFVEWDCELSISSSDVDTLLQEHYDEIAPAETEAPETPAVEERREPEPVVAEAKPVAPPIHDTAGANADPKKTADHAAAAPPQATIRVDLDKVDRLINLVGELVINQAVLSQRVSEAGLSRASSVMIGLDELEQLTRDIQDSVMAIRAQPVKPIFQRMSRIVREVAAMTGKQVRLVVDGENTEVDKTVIERLTDPLTHMIRNAVDHGIEKAEARLAAGKPEEGTLKLAAMHRSGRIVIEVGDDGGGINRPRVRQIAITKGLIPEDAQLTDEEIDNLIFFPGFSTNETASAISGRGVGMDVVKRAIQQLGGRISISSRPGLGSTFSMSLPLTLAVLDGMVVTVAKQTLVVPLTAIIETLQPKQENVHALGTGVRVIKNRNSFIPLIDVGSMLRYRSEDIDPTTQVALLIESENSSKCALLVDAIQGQRQVVIKSLETNYGHVHGIAAATILGDGRVALIVDVDAIVTGVKSDSAGSDMSMMAAE
jgi:two-component system, chemotaxis family, sensor kinase CheA